MHVVERAMPKFPNPLQFLPLRPVEFEILLVLSAGEAHGYAIIKEAQARSDLPRRIDTGTLYRTLRRLTQAGMVEPSDQRPAPDADDQRRRYYAITPLGRRVAAAEAQRLATQVEAARALDLIGSPRRKRGGA
jgi:DNA-binding PadR family transcriptional regulator